MKPYALVLGGGGARGAYQIGAWSVLRELGIRFNAVIGTSVGALNGSFVVRKAYREACRLWEVISLADVVSLPSSFVNGKAFEINRKNIEILDRFRREIIRNKGMDTAPLRRIIESSVREAAIRGSKTDFGLVLYNMKSLRAEHVFLDGIPGGSLADYLMATSALPGFKPADIDGRAFLDGGVYDNVPVDAALKRGYRRLIVVDLSAIGVTRKVDPAGTDTVYIRNSLELGHMLDFSPQAKARNQALGRLDTLRVFGLLQGIRYFVREDPGLLKRLEAALRSPEVLKEARRITGFRDMPEGNAEALLRRNLPEKLRLHRNPAEAYLECAAIALGLEPVREYTRKSLLDAVRKGFAEKEQADQSHDLAAFAERLRRFDPFDIFDSTREMLPEYFLVKNEGHTAMKVAARVFPELVPAKIFRLVLERAAP